MKAITLQNFRAMQLAVKGACKSSKTETLILQGVDCIRMGDRCEITAISLDYDIVTFKLTYNESESCLPLNCLADEVIEEITDTMKAKALEIAHRDVMVNLAGELTNDKDNVRL